MSVPDAVLLAISVPLMCYLGVALFKPERF